MRIDYDWLSLFYRSSAESDPSEKVSLFGYHYSYAVNFAILNSFSYHNCPWCVLTKIIKILENVMQNIE